MYMNMDGIQYYYFLNEMYGQFKKSKKSKRRK